MQSPNDRIFLSPPDVRGRERELVLDAVDSNWIAPLGPHVDAFEAEIARYVGAQHAVALSSGTAALHLALLCAGVTPRSCVITASLTFVASANAIRYCDATPIFVDSSPNSWNMCPARLEEAIETTIRDSGTPPAAIVAVDLYGHCADYDSITKVAKKWDIPLIEDAAEALGATYHGRYAGTLGKMGIFSFNGNKILSTSGGGMLIVNDKETAEHARHLATQARKPVLYYEHETVGYNYRLSNLLAAVGRAQLETLDERIGDRGKVHQLYREHLGDVDGISFIEPLADSTTNHWLTCVLVEPSQFGCGRDDIIGALNSANIESRPVWKPMHLQPLFEKERCYGGDVSRRMFETGLCLPSGSNLKDDDVRRICEIILSQRGAL